VRAEFAAKGSLILDFVAKKETIQVTDADLEARYQELADQRGQTIEAIKGYFVQDEAVEELRARLLEEKTLDWLLEQSKLVAPSDVKAEAAPVAAEPEAAPAKKVGRRQRPLRRRKCPRRRLRPRRLRRRPRWKRPLRTRSRRRARGRKRPLTRSKGVRVAPPTLGRPTGRCRGTVATGGCQTGAPTWSHDALHCLGRVSTLWCT
jgi:hypothetical protein